MNKYTSAVATALLNQRPIFSLRYSRSFLDIEFTNWQNIVMEMADALEDVDTSFNREDFMIKTGFLLINKDNNKTFVSTIDDNPSWDIKRISKK